MIGIAKAMIGQAVAQAAIHSSEAGSPGPRKNASQAKPTSTSAAAQPEAAIVPSTGPTIFLHAEHLQFSQHVFGCKKQEMPTEHPDDCTNGGGGDGGGSGGGSGLGEGGGGDGGGNTQHSAARERPHSSATGPGQQFEVSGTTEGNGPPVCPS